MWCSEQLADLSPGRGRGLSSGVGSISPPSAANTGIGSPTRRYHQQQGLVAAHSHSYSQHGASQASQTHQSLSQTQLPASHSQRLDSQQVVPPSASADSTGGGEGDAPVIFCPSAVDDVNFTEHVQFQLDFSAVLLVQIWQFSVFSVSPGALIATLKPPVNVTSTYSPVIFKPLAALKRRCTATAVANAGAGVSSSAALGINGCDDDRVSYALLLSECYLTLTRCLIRVRLVPAAAGPPAVFPTTDVRVAHCWLLSSVSRRMLRTLLSHLCYTFQNVSNVVIAVGASGTFGAVFDAILVEMGRCQTSKSGGTRNTTPAKTPAAAVNDAGIEVDGQEPYCCGAVAPLCELSRQPFVDALKNIKNTEGVSAADASSDEKSLFVLQQRQVLHRVCLSLLLLAQAVPRAHISDFLSVPFKATKKNVDITVRDLFYAILVFSECLSMATTETASPRQKHKPREQATAQIPPRPAGQPGTPVPFDNASFSRYKGTPALSPATGGACAHDPVPPQDELLGKFAVEFWLLLCTDAPPNSGCATSAGGRDAAESEMVHRLFRSIDGSGEDQADDDADAPRPLQGRSLYRHGETHKGIITEVVSQLGTAPETDRTTDIDTALSVNTALFAQYYYPLCVPSPGEGSAKSADLSLAPLALAQSLALTLAGLVEHVAVVHSCFKLMLQWYVPIGESSGNGDGNGRNCRRYVAAERMGERVVGLWQDLIAAVGMTTLMADQVHRLRAAERDKPSQCPADSSMFTYYEQSAEVPVVSNALPAVVQSMANAVYAWAARTHCICLLSDLPSHSQISGPRIERETVIVESLWWLLHHLSGFPVNLLGPYASNETNMDDSAPILPSDLIRKSLLQGSSESLFPPNMACLALLLMAHHTARLPPSRENHSSGSGVVVIPFLKTVVAHCSKAALAETLALPDVLQYIPPLLSAFGINIGIDASNSDTQVASTVGGLLDVVGIIWHHAMHLVIRMDSARSDTSSERGEEGREAVPAVHAGVAGEDGGSAYFSSSVAALPPVAVHAATRAPLTAHRYFASASASSQTHQLSQHGSQVHIQLRTHTHTHTGKLTSSVLLAGFSQQYGQNMEVCGDAADGPDGLVDQSAAYLASLASQPGVQSPTPQLSALSVDTRTSIAAGIRSVVLIPLYALQMFRRDPSALHRTICPNIDFGRHSGSLVDSLVNCSSSVNDYRQLFQMWLQYERQEVAVAELLDTGGSDSQQGMECGGSRTEGGMGEIPPFDAVSVFSHCRFLDALGDGLEVVSVGETTGTQLQLYCYFIDHYSSFFLSLLGSWAHCSGTTGMDDTSSGDGSSSRLGPTPREFLCNPVTALIRSYVVQLEDMVASDLVSVSVSCPQQSAPVGTVAGAGPEVVVIPQSLTKEFLHNTSQLITLNARVGSGVDVLDQWVCRLEAFGLPAVSAGNVDTDHPQGAEKSSLFCLLLRQLLAVLVGPDTHTHQELLSQISFLCTDSCSTAGGDLLPLADLLSGKDSLQSLASARVQPTRMHQSGAASVTCSSDRLLTSALFLFLDLLLGEYFALLKYIHYLKAVSVFKVLERAATLSHGQRLQGSMPCSCREGSASTSASASSSPGEAGMCSRQTDITRARAAQMGIVSALLETLDALRQVLSATDVLARGETGRLSGPLLPLLEEGAKAFTHHADAAYFRPFATETRLNGQATTNGNNSQCHSGHDNVPDGGLASSGAEDEEDRRKRKWAEVDNGLLSTPPKAVMAIPPPTGHFRPSKSPYWTDLENTILSEIGMMEGNVASFGREVRHFVPPGSSYIDL